MRFILPEIPFRPFAVLVLLLSTFFCSSQKYVQVNTFTTDNGLSSNHIYDMTEDNNGFLWIATNNGVSRFDGKYFQNFSVNDGLPSNDAVQIVKDSTGTIWVNCYKEHLCYFDQQSNRFVLLKGNKNLEQVAKIYCILSVNSNGDLVLEPSNGMTSCLIRKTGKPNESFILLPSKRIILIGHRQFNTTGHRNNKNYKVSFFDAEKPVDSVTIPMNSETANSFFNNIFYQQNDFCLKRISITTILPVKYNVDSIRFHFPVSRFIQANQQKFVVISSSMIYLLDEKKFTIQDSIENIKVANTTFIDKNDGFWVGTMDKGLVQYNTGGVQQMKIPTNIIKPNFLSIATSPKGKVFAGNFYGQLLQVDKNHFTSRTISTSEKGYWLRKTLCAGDKVITLSDYFCGVDFKSKIIIENKTEGWYYSLKSATLLNDSIVIIGSTKGLIKLNINTKNYTPLNSIQDRTLSLVKGAGNVVYYIGPDGLYEYDMEKNTETHIPLNDSTQSCKLTALAFAADSTLWAATTGGNIMVLKNDKIIGRLTRVEGLQKNLVCIKAFKNKVWVGSKTGISIVSYSLAYKHFTCSISNVSKTDGLPSNVINDFAFYNDTVFVATENGIAAIPFNYPPFRPNIIPRLTDVKVNQQHMPVADHFSFAANQNNIELTFAGVDLSGHFSTIQYRLDADTGWNDLAGNALNIQLYSGRHDVQVRAVDVNNHPGNNILKLYITVATPFYKQVWFITLLAFLFPGLIFWYFFNRRKKLLHAAFEKRLAAERVDFEKQLAVEKAGNRITADLHDDIGTNLSSIHVYSTVAKQLIGTDTAKAKEILDKLTLQTQGMLENLGEIIWSLKTGKDQFVNIESRIKNYVSDVLGATNIAYTVKIESSINNIKDIRLRKNIILIAKEAVNNAVKYSKATIISVNVSNENSYVKIEIADNGIGFDEKAENRGNGLGNMQKRTEELHGHFYCTGCIGSGTLITATIPIVDLED